MTADFDKGSAKIYQFPAGGRAALAPSRGSGTGSTVDPALLPINEAVCADGWYHEAAIQEAKPARDR
ncbi:MAG: DUF2735 domain-containing protein [Bradyrhizobium sp.]|jgi:Protein of unknown function (DUF2735)